MRDEDKTKEQLVRELAATRRRIAELEDPKVGHKRAEGTIQGSRIWLSVAGAFVLLCILAWLNEILDLPHLLLGAPRTPVNWQEAIIETVLIGIVGSFAVSRLISDVTERKRAEEVLRESEERFREMASLLPQVVGETDLRGNFTFVNQNAFQMFGYTQKDFEEGINILQVLIPEDHERAKEGIQKVLKGERPGRNEYTAIRKDDSAFPVLVYSRPTIRQNKPAGMISIVVDITERKRVEEALRESEERYRTLIENQGEGVGSVDPEECFTFANPAAHEIFGVTQGELVGCSLREFVDPETFDLVRAQTEKRRAGGKSIYRMEFIRPDGERGHLLVTATPRFDGEGQLVGTFGIFRDITELVQAEESLKQRATQLALLNDVGARIAAVLELDILLDGTAHLVQEGFGYHHVGLFIVDRERGELVMKARAGDFNAFFPPEHRIKLGQGVVGWVGSHGERLLANDVDAEPRYINFYPDVIPTRSELSVPIRVGGEVVGVLDVQSLLLDAFDETDVMVMETLASQLAVAVENARLVGGLEALVAARTAEIVAEQEKNEAILRSVGDAIAMSDPEMRLRYVNPAFTALTGYTAQEAIGQHVSLLFRGTMSEQDRQSLRLALAQGDVWRGEVSNQRKDGRPYEASMTIVPLRDGEGRLTGYVSSHQDISRRKGLERARSRFMTNVSHELRTPVANMKLYAHLLRMGRKPEKIQRYTQVIEEQADRLAELIQDILEMTGLDSGQAVMAWKPVSLPTVIGDTVTRYQSRAEETGLTLVAKPVPPDLPVVKGDQSRLNQSLGELVENAVIFTPSGGQVTVETGTAEACPGQSRRAEEQLWVMIAVHDTGPGISPEEQERVFDRFFRGSLAESGHVPGTGLGLSIAQEIVRAHGGWVTVESEIGEGSTFTLWLPSVSHQPDRAPGVRG